MKFVKEIVRPFVIILYLVSAWLDFRSHLLKRLPHFPTTIVCYWLWELRIFSTRYFCWHWLVQTANGKGTVYGKKL